MCASKAPYRIKKILLVAAINPQSLKSIICGLRQHYPAAVIDVLISHNGINNNQQRLNWLPVSSSSIEPEDFHNIEHYQVVCLAISHVARASYKTLVECCARVGKTLMLWTASGQQALDVRDSLDFIPEPIGKRRRFCRTSTNKIILFRPSDQSLSNLQDNWQKQGKKIQRVESIAALEEAMTPGCEVVFNYCITDYSALSVAIELCFKHHVKLSAYITVDLVDLCENEKLKYCLLDFNRSCLHQFDYVYVMKTRSYFIERYRLADSKFELLSSTGSTELTAAVETSVRVKTKTLKLVYHGLNYYWHELAEFLPVFVELRQHCHVRLDIFGRVHESLRLGGKELFPKAEARVKQAVEQYRQFPEVCVHGFAATHELKSAFSQADYYVGLTRLNSNMAKSEFRTGIIEALAFDLKILHKKSPALNEMGLSQQDYLNIDSADSREAAYRIIRDWHGY